jgi:predicted phage terminase large subunit-like protein
MGDPLPLKKNGASNPGDIGHYWVKEDFIPEQYNKESEYSKKDVDEKNSKKFLFISSSWHDNPFIDQVSYSRQLDKLDHITRQQLKFGDWEINPEGGLFKRVWFIGVSSTPTIIKTVRFWDLAKTVPTPGTDPDYTVGLKMGIDEDNNAYILDVVRIRKTPKDAKDRIKETAISDKHSTKIVLELEGGASSGYVLDELQRKVLAGYWVTSQSTMGKAKEERANPLSSFAEHGNVYYVKGKVWNKDFLDEVESFKTKGIHDDQVDAMSGAYFELFGKPEPAKIYV